MTVAELLKLMRPRAQNLRLVDESTGFVSEEELRFYLQNQVRYLATNYQLDMFLGMNRRLLVTQSGVENYPVPSTLSGWWSPDDDRTSGLALVLDEANNDRLNLRYRDPARYQHERTNTADAPSIFTVADNQLWFSPIPDAVYTIQGVHKKVLEAGDDIANMYAYAVIVQTLYRMAEDKGKLTTELAAEQRDVVGHLVNNEDRLHQRFKRAYSERVYGWRTRRYHGWGR